MTHSIDEERLGVEQSWSGVLAFAETERRLSLWEFETKLRFLMLAHLSQPTPIIAVFSRRGPL